MNRGHLYKSMTILEFNEFLAYSKFVLSGVSMHNKMKKTFVYEEVMTIDKERKTTHGFMEKCRINAVDIALEFA